MVLDYVALGLLIFTVLVLFYGIIAIHDIPYEIAKHRNHPHQDAIHIAGWVSLFTLHAIWPFLWIWATLYRPERGYGFAGGAGADEIGRLGAAVLALQERMAELEQRVRPAAAPTPPPVPAPKPPVAAPKAQTATSSQPGTGKSGETA
jgi:hypothetical protein